MTSIWRPSEIIVNSTVANDPVTQNILSMCPSVSVKYVDSSTPNIVKAASDTLTDVDEDADVISHIVTGKRVLYVSPAGNGVVKGFEFEDDRMICPEFEKLIWTSNGCYFNCDWCFLKATFRANQNYITVRVEYDSIKKQIEDTLRTTSQPVMFNTGEMGDSLALEHLTMAARTFIPWFAEQPNGYLYMLTKSDNVNDILKLKHNGHTILAWSVNAELVSNNFEMGAPRSHDRLKAAHKAQEYGYPIRIRLDPIVPIRGWQNFYSGIIKSVFDHVKPERITLGTLRFEPQLYQQRASYMTSRLLKILDELEVKPMLEKQELGSGKKSVGKYSFSPGLRAEIFEFAIKEIRKYSDCDIALCKETHDVWQAVGLNPAECKCVCKYGSVDMSIPKREVIEVTKPKKATPATEPKTPAAAPATSAEEYEPRKLYHLDIAALNADPDQPRKSIDDAELKELAASIEKHGVLQPVLFRKDSEGRLIIVSGERRYRASLLAKKKTIPAIFTVDNAAEIALVENLLRVDLTAIEEAEALQRLQTEANYTNRQLATVIGKAESTISEILKLNLLPKKIRDKHRTNKALARRTLLEVAKAPTPEAMEKLFKKALSKTKKRDELRADRHTATRGADVVCRTMSNGLLRVLPNLDLATVPEDKRAEVEKALGDTLAALASKLGYQLVRQ